MKKSTIYSIAIIGIIIFFGIFMIKGGSGSNQTTSIGKGNVQEIVIGMKNYNYYPNTINVKAGMPVRISLDSSVSGCFRSFTIRDFGISKYLKTPKDYVEFTPTKPGRYTFACSMGMGTGVLIVE